MISWILQYSIYVHTIEDGLMQNYKLYLQFNFQECCKQISEAAAQQTIHITYILGKGQIQLCGVFLWQKNYNGKNSS